MTRDLGDLDRLMGDLCESGKGGELVPTQSLQETSLCFYGGDGSVSRGITALIRHQGEKATIPPVLVVRAGTINMLCSVLGHNEKVERTLNRWRVRGPETLKTIPTIKVQVEGRAPQYGFVFAWGLGFRVLKQYYARSASPDVFDAAVLALKTFLSGLRPDADLRPLFKSEDVNLKVDGKPISVGPLRALLAGTISRVSLGIKPFAPEPICPGSFHVSANGMSLVKIALHSPSLLFQLGDQRNLSRRGHRLFSATQVQELNCELSEGFTLDGEMFEIEARSKVKISPGPIVRFWSQSKA